MDTAIAVALIGVGTTAGAAGASMISDRASAGRDHSRWLRERQYEAAVEFIAACRAVRWNDAGSWTTAVRRGDELAIVAPAGMRQLVSTLLTASYNLRVTEGYRDIHDMRDPYDAAIDLFLESAQPLITRSRRSRRLFRTTGLRTDRLSATTGAVLADQQAIAAVTARLDALESTAQQSAVPAEEPDEADGQQ